MSNVLSRDNVIAEAAALATNEGISSNAKIELMSTMAIAAQARSITEQDAGTVFDAYLAAKQATVTDATEVVGNGKSGAKVTEGYARKTKSEWKQVIGCGAHPTADGPLAIATARDVAGEKGIHVYDAIVKIAREQKKVQDTLTREEIEAHLAGEDKPKDNSEIKVLSDIAKQLEKVIKGIEGTDTSEGRPAYPSDQASAALAAINSRIADITPAAGAGVTALMAAGLSYGAAVAALAKAVRKGAK